MHAPLGVPERQLACSDLISALNECHAQGMIYRFAGKCNVQKEALTMCLRKEVRPFYLCVPDLDVVEVGG
jgi:COX assembly protein 2